MSWAGYQTGVIFQMSNFISPKQFLFLWICSCSATEHRSWIIHDNFIKNTFIYIPCRNVYKAYLGFWSWNTYVKLFNTGLDCQQDVIPKLEKYKQIVNSTVGIICFFFICIDERARVNFIGAMTYFIEEVN